MYKCPSSISEYDKGLGEILSDSLVGPGKLGYFFTFCLFNKSCGIPTLFS